MGGYDAFYNRDKQRGAGTGSAELGPKVSPQVSSANPNVMAGSENAGQPGGSPYEAGSGFVNLSHLLALNGASGQASARDAASQLAKQGQSAQSAIQSAQDKFNQGVTQATVRSDDVIKKSQSRPYGQANTGSNQSAQSDINAKRLQNVKDALNKANQGYQGPQDLMSQPGYGALSKQVSNAQNRAQNDTTGAGMAAQVAQDTGLSPRQAAASAFYMGVSNPYLQGTAKRFAGLGGMLQKANEDSVKSADMARQITQGSQGPLNDYYNQITAPPPANPELPRPDTQQAGPWVSHPNHTSDEDTTRTQSDEEYWANHPDEAPVWWQKKYGYNP